MLKILQARLQQYVNRELPDVQAGFRKGKGTRDQIANILWIIEKAKEFQKNIWFCFMTMPKPLTVWITINWKILKEMGIADHLTCLLRNLYAGQEATVRTGHGTTDWCQIRKGPSSQSYGFSSSHVWMWDLDYKESWAPKDWCFWTVLEKTWESLGLQGDPTSPS